MPMPCHSRLVFFGLIALAVTACSRTSTPDTNAITNNGQNMPQTNMTQTNKPQNDGAPRITDSPDGVHIEYRVRGAGSPLVVLVHGWSCDSNYWRAQVPALTPRYTVLTVDLAGHGASGRNRSDWSMGNFGADVAAAVNAYWLQNKEAPRQVVLVGHSMGGPVVIEAARRLRGSVLGVIGVDTFKGFGQPIASAKEREARLAAMSKDFIGATRAMVTTSFFRPDADPVLVQQIASDMSSAPPEVGIPAVRGMNDWGQGLDLKDITVPIVAIEGDMTPVDDVKSRAIAPTFRSIVMKGRGHFLMMEDPAGFNPILIQEIDALIKPAPGQ